MDLTKTKDMNEAVQRIAYHEEIMRTCRELIDQGTDAVSRFMTLQKGMAELAAYYGSEQWKQDYADDEAGLFPACLKRGVLSEDGIDHLLDDGQEWTEQIIEELLAKPYRIIDILPEPVPEGRHAQYAGLERWYLAGPKNTELRRKYAELIIKLSCWHDICISRKGTGEWLLDPEAAKVFELFEADETGRILVLMPQAETLAVMNGDETYMTVYGMPGEMALLMEKLALAAGLFLWGEGT